MTKAKLSFIRKLDCAMPHEQHTPTEAAHIRTAKNSGTGCKPDDKYTIPLCKDCHTYSHQHGEPALLEKMYGGNYDKYSAKDFLLALANEYQLMFEGL